MSHHRFVLATLLAIGLSACGEKTAEGDTAQLPLGDSLVPISDAAPLDTSKPAAPPETVFVQKAPVVVRRPTPRPPAPTPVTPAPRPSASAPSLVSGVAIQTVMMDSVHSQYTRVGDPIRVRVANDVMSSDGKVVIPAGSVITLAVTEIGQANNKGEKGLLSLAGRSISINGESHPITARATDYEYEMKARGVGATDVARTGAGAAAGAIIGRVIGGKTGTIVGAVGGAAAGAAVASQSANRDIIVHAGKAMTITLRDEFVRP
ncbi:MAG: glycine zipper 2TM domain-containing protein [Gemmatimonadales bacterium]|nr:glycine zipper 2TM domain-containing protein [Gemmatimonadales bacterium]